MQVAPGVELVNEAFIDCYLIEEAGSLTLVDAGIAALWPQLLAGLERTGRSLGDIEAVLLTHAHSDHTGMAERVRVEAPASVHIHDEDLPYAREGRMPRRDGAGQLAAFLHFQTYRTLAYMFRKRGLGMPRVSVLSGFADGASLDVPGRPTTVHVPGHTAGSAALHFPEHGVLCTGDALVTFDAITGRTGPRLAPDAFGSDPAAARASLARLEGLDADVILPGHGLPFHGPPASAVALAREADR
jgi:glyoxylase-like metal-dependent hydrolase (beta-lactamase superfamily II)